jgi:hypothetical protein
MSGDTRSSTTCCIQSAHYSAVSLEHLRVPIDQEAALGVKQRRLNLDGDVRGMDHVFERGASKVIGAFTTGSTRSVRERLLEDRLIDLEHRSEFGDIRSPA